MPEALAAHRAALHDDFEQALRALERQSTRDAIITMAETARERGMEVVTVTAAAVAFLVAAGCEHQAECRHALDLGAQIGSFRREVGARTFDAELAKFIAEAKALHSNGDREPDPPQPKKPAESWADVAEQALAATFEESSSEPSLEALAPRLWVDAEDWVEPDISPRPWIARGYLLRGAVTLIAGPSSVGKSMLMVGWTIALALGQPWHRFKPTARSRVIFYNVEDDRDEQRRRLSATLRQFDRKPKDLRGNVLICGPTERAALVECTQDGICQFTALMDDLEHEVDRMHPDVLIVDPLVELHNADENNNIAMRHVIALFRAFAIVHDLAVVVLHHTRKGAQNAPGEQDVMRGAGSIIGAARVGLTIMPMTPEDAEELKIKPDARANFFRVDSAKQNYAPIHEAEWFERFAYKLANGEEVAAALPWNPTPDGLETASHFALNQALDTIAQGLPDGRRYSASTRGTSASANWAGSVLMQQFSTSKKKAKKRINEWLQSGLLFEEEYRDPKRRRPAQGLRVNDTKRPS